MKQSVGIKYSLRDLLFDVNNLTPQGSGDNFCRAHPFFGSTSTICRFGERERFRDGQYNLVSS